MKCGKKKKTGTHAEEIITLILPSTGKILHCTVLMNPKYKQTMRHSTVCEKIFYFVAQIKAFPNTNRLLNSLAYGVELRGNPPAHNVNVMPS